MLKLTFLAACALIAACKPEVAPPPHLTPLCGTPSECAFDPVGLCSDNRERVLLDYEPSPYPNLIQCCPYHLDKEPAQNAYISARLDTHKTPWTLNVWSDQRQIVFPATWFCMDEYTGDYYLYKSAAGDTLRIALYDHLQVQHYLDTQEQIIFTIEIECP